VAVPVPSGGTCISGCCSGFSSTKIHINITITKHPSYSHKLPCNHHTTKQLFSHVHYLFMPRLIYKLPIPNWFVPNPNINSKTPISHNIHNLNISRSLADIYNIEFMFVHINYHGTSQKAPRPPKQPKLGCAVCVAWRVTPRPPGGSWWNPKKWAKMYVSPGGSWTTARRFLENSRNTTENERKTSSTILLWFRSYIHKIAKLKQAIGTALTWISLASP